jgi:mono/diheme cytochrome c family protein
MNMRSGYLLAASLLLFGASAVNAADERSGEQLFKDFGCVLCHGSTGYRGGIGGRPIAPMQHSLDAFRILVRSPGKAMPAFAPQVLSEEQLKKLYQFLRSVSPSPEVAELPQLKSLGAGR